MTNDRLCRTLAWQLLDMFGLAPDLVSDSVMERVLKRYPSYFRPIVKDAVAGEWVQALKMVQEQKAYVAKRRDSNKRKGVRDPCK